MWYSNSLAQWFDIPTTATPTHDEKGTASEKAFGSARVGESPALLRSLGPSLDLKGLFPALCKTEFILPVGVGRGDVITTSFKSTVNGKNKPTVNDKNKP